mmetsp:Transcript_152651/g.487766  ORF Transcript_152651/g.487766 Transcript_152651/m.487766 type:complete len:216 (+) Transcript_152651:337-984(+)
MLRVANLEYASWATVVFQRCSVVAGDLLLVLGARRLGSTLGSSAQGWSTALLALVGPGLLIVDHVHFQYNGMLFGVLLFSIADLEAGRIYRGAALFAALLNMKQIFLYLAPVYFVFLLRGHCGCVFGVGPLGIRLNFGNLVRLGLTVLAVFALAWLPILATGQGMQMVRRCTTLPTEYCRSWDSGRIRVHRRRLASQRCMSPLCCGPCLRRPPSP